MVFRNREDAGNKLAQALAEYRGRRVLVLAVPKGGIEVGYRVADALHADFSVVVTRKLPFPDNPEAGFGAVAEDGSTFICQEAARWLTRPAIERIIEQQEREIERRINILREERPLPPISGRTVILVDDGIAMGSTMRASIMLCQGQKAAEIIVAAPVAGMRVVQELEGIVNRVVVLETPPYFRAVAEAYMNWYDVSDQEAVALLERWERTHSEHITEEGETVEE